jgi:chemotaxis protein MotA
VNILGGFAFVMFCVFGGFLIAGGNLWPVLAALPFEMLIIGGAATGALVMSNSLADCKRMLLAVGAAIKGAHYRKQDYLDLCSLLYRLLRVSQTKGMQGLEVHIERPKDSAIFNAYPKLMRDQVGVSLICDYLRMVNMNADDPYQVEEMMARELRKIRAERLRPANILSTTSDALPALGIVAAVLGVIKTMASINESPAILGAMLGSALVGTFLGVLLAYGLVGPIAERMRNMVEEELEYYEVIRAVIVAHLQGLVPQVAAEVGRKTVPTEFMPTFEALEAALMDSRGADSGMRSSDPAGSPATPVREQAAA